MNSEEIFRIIDFIERDHPEYFWLGKTKTRYTLPSKEVTAVEFDYCMSRSTAVNRQKKIEESLTEFLGPINDGMSDYEAVKTVYENIIRLADYDTLGLNESKKQPRGNRPDDLRSIYGVFVKKKAVCAGYAKAMQYLLNRLGIECVYVRGNAKGG